MAKRSQDLAAAKAKKQKIILIVGGVLLLAVAAFQGPKLMKHGGSTAAPAESSSSATGAGASLTPTGGATTAPKGSAMVAGVVLPHATVVKVAPNQLASFTLFEVKDPFVPGVGENQATTAADASSTGSGQASPTGSSGSAGATTGDASTSTGTTTPAAPPPPPIVYATIDLDGKPQQVQAKDQFPTAAPLFVVRSVKKKHVKIAVAGGSFDDSQTVTLTQGKKVTLVNTATGVRYELKLVYTGSQPEVIQGFTTTTGATDTSAAVAGSTTTTAAK